jgi:ubiquinone/menaquinone biosynthesis C-methylase UbiE
MGVNQEQQDFWSSDAGEKWIKNQREMDILLTPVLQLVLDHARLQVGETVLDIGCGAGTSTLQAAQLVGDTGHCTGLDISDTLLGHAACTLDHSNIDWLLADAQTHQFQPRTFDAMISRFGVMFFSDTVSAFANIKSALKPQGRIVMAAWGPASENPWFMLPAQAAKAQLGEMPKTDRSLPGPFAFEDHTRVIEMLEQAGFININTTNHAVNLTATGGLPSATQLCCEIGPANAALKYFAGTAEDRKSIISELTKLFKPFETKEGLNISASIHLFTAQVGQDRQS